MNHKAFKCFEYLGLALHALSLVGGRLRSRANLVALLLQKIISKLPGNDMFRENFLQSPGRSGPGCSPCQSGTGHQPSVKFVSSSLARGFVDTTYIALLLLVLVLVLGGNAGVLAAGKTLNTVSSDLASTVQLGLGVLLWMVSLSFLHFSKAPLTSRLFLGAMQRSFSQTRPLRQSSVVSHFLFRPTSAWTPCFS